MPKTLQSQLHNVFITSKLVLGNERIIINGSITSQEIELSYCGYHVKLKDGTKRGVLNMAGG